MNKKLKFLVSAGLIGALSLSMAACNTPANNEGNNDNNGNNGPTTEQVAEYVVKNRGSEAELKIMDDLSTLIEQARTSLDANVRKPIYSQALDKVMELAIELPTYQRKNLYVYDKTVIDESTLITGDEVTPYQSPLAKIWNVEFANRADNASKAFVIASQTMDGVFNPYFYTSGYDGDVVNLTQMSLLVNNKNAEMVAREDTVASAYEMVMRNENGQAVTDSADAATTEYRFTIRDDITFSDGSALTMDDVLFNYYMFLDPAYTGSTTMYTLPILGLRNYRTQLDDATYEKYSAMADAIYAAGKGEGYEANETYTQAQYEQFWNMFDANGATFAQSIVDYVYSKYLGYSEAYFGKTADEVSASDGMKVAFGMLMWGFGEVNEDGLFVSDENHSWTLEDEDFPTAEDYFAVMEAAYGYDYADLLDTEAADASRDFIADTLESFIVEAGKAESTESYETISGIKTEGNVLSVTIEGVDPVAIYQLATTVAPKAYYTKGYTYNTEELIAYGVQFNNSDFMRYVQQITVPMGAGPYKATNAAGEALTGNNASETGFFANGIVYFAANDDFVAGAPKIKYVRYQTVTSAELYNSVKTNTVHYADPSADSETIGKLNTTDKEQLGYQLVDNLGYGYIGINARFVNELEARRAIMHAMDRSLVLDYYTGGLATVIERGMSRVSWAYPEDAEAYYAFDGTGKTSCDLLKSVGYKVVDPETGVVYNPNGPVLKLTFSIAGDDLTDHPAAQTLQKAADILNKIGCDITCVADANLLSKLSTSDNLAVWCAAWQATIDPDMYQVYHKDSQATSVLSWGYDYLLGRVGSLAPWAQAK